MDIFAFVIFIGQVIGAAIGISGSIWGFIKWVIKPVKSFLKKIETIHSELTPNSGGSIKDSIAVIKESVLKTEKYQKARLSHEDVGYFDADETGQITWANRAFLRLLRVGEEEVLGNGWKNFLYYKDKQRVIEEWETSIEDKRDFKSLFRFLSSDNTVRCVICEGFIVKGSKGNLIGYAAAVIEQRDEICNEISGRDQFDAKDTQ